MARTRHDFLVRRTERLTDHLIRLHLGGPGFATFQPGEFTDSYVKLLIPAPDGEVTRTYTVRAVDTEAQTIAIDFVHHGPEGFAGPWAELGRRPSLSLRRMLGRQRRPPEHTDRSMITSW